MTVYPHTHTHITINSQSKLLNAIMCWSVSCIFCEIKLTLFMAHSFCCQLFNRQQLQNTYAHFCVIFLLADMDQSTNCIVLNYLPNAETKKISFTVRPTYSVSKLYGDIRLQLAVNDFELTLVSVDDSRPVIWIEVLLIVSL